jgi:hypothetical protein
LHPFLVEPIGFRVYSHCSVPERSQHLHPVAIVPNTRRDSATWLGYATKLQQRSLLIWNEIEDQQRENGFKTGIGKMQSPRIAHLKVDSIGKEIPTHRGSDVFLGWVDPQYAYIVISPSDCKRQRSGA